MLPFHFLLLSFEVNKRMRKASTPVALPLLPNGNAAMQLEDNIIEKQKSRNYRARNTCKFVTNAIYLTPHT